MNANPHLVTLRGRVDAHFDAAVARTPTAFECRAGCSACCQRFSVWAVEAAPLREALADLELRDPATRERVRSQGRDPDATACALLVDDRCSVYAERPLICRSHGLPIAVPAEGASGSDALTVDHCPLNFRAELGVEIPRASVLVLDAINRPLVVLAELTAPGAARVALADLAAE